MSRAYRVSWVRSSSTVSASDHMKVSLSLLGILPEEEMQTLLREELAKKGWSKEENNTMVKKTANTKATLSSNGKSITIRADQQTIVSARATTKEQVENRIRKQVKKQEKGLKEDVTKILIKEEPAIRQSLQEAMQRVYRRALEKKAASLGEVESITEKSLPEGEYEVLIKVKA